jgi:hypothetical protein
MEKSNTGSIVGVSIVSLLLLGTATYFIIKGSKKKPLPPIDDKKPKGADQPTTTNVAETTTTTTTTQGTSFFDAIRNALQGGLKTKDETSVTGFTFPIKFGQRNDSVKKLQQLILNYDNRLLPKYKDDGGFGNETRDALSKIINKTQIDNQADIDALVIKIKEKVSGIMTGALINQSLGIKLF